MAKEILMKHPQTGVIKKGFYGFSWTSFLVEYQQFSVVT
jgi:uncharacterized membrane protein